MIGFARGDFPLANVGALMVAYMHGSCTGPECYELSKDGRVFLSATVAQGQFEVPNFEGLVLDLDDLWSEVDLLEDDEPSET